MAPRLVCHDLATRVGTSRNTERKYRAPLTNARMLEGDPATLPERAEIKAVIAASHGDAPLPRDPPASRTGAEVTEAMLDAGAGPTAIYDRLRLDRLRLDRLRLDERFEGSLGAVKRLCVRVRKVKGIAPENVATRVETPAGEDARVDFGYVGKLNDADDDRPRKRGPSSWCWLSRA